MRRMILRMIATGSLSAFSASVLHGTDALASGSGPSAVGGARAPSVRTIRSAQPQQPAAQSAPLPLDPGKSSAAPAGRVPPRGSLLDLSV